MIAERKCLSCGLTARNPDVTPEQRLQMAAAGVSTRLCLAVPPQVIIIHTPNGQQGTMAYPSVDANTISCNLFTPGVLHA